MGCEYIYGMDSSFDKPFIYLKTETAVSVFGTVVWLNPPLLDSLLLYTECPELKEMSYVRANPTPPPGNTLQPTYSAQALLDVLNEDGGADPAHGGIYVEYVFSGQSVFLNFDLSSMVNHVRSYCDGATPPPAPDFDPGNYDGTVELMRTILEDLFDLAPPFPGGGGGTAGTGATTSHSWGLAQNVPNPCFGTAEICFEVARGERVRILLYDARGRQVRELEDRGFAPGHHSLHWNGKNDAGAPVASGIYFYEMRAGEFTARRKLIVLR
jgi:hypothetical protein